ncbi:peptidoglycan-recognition protein LB-like [Pectinophora gossypiella]|uniref:Peptidoglycan-recognition protein n=1 Tax=Pectinophora gossypiella TaxID=13191 RepID=A0A1E1WV23_PECGO|nr:peptidoglycan-recognition protein LB-like [Pectinophora gossypiella]
MSFKSSTYLAVFVLGIAVTAFKISDDAEYVFYNRESWGAVEATDKRPLDTPVPYVVIHHTYIPPACYSKEACMADMRSMQKYHMETMDFGDIGYNFCVGSEGGAYEGRGWDILGIHARRANNFSIGICLIGDWREELPPAITLETTKALIKHGVSRGAIRPDYKLIGHMQATPTECPGTALMEEISTWKHYVPGNITF